MLLHLVPQELADLRLVGTATEPLEHGGEHAVVLVLHVVGDADRVPLTEQMPQVILNGWAPGLYRPGLPS